MNEEEDTKRETFRPEKLKDIERKMKGQDTNKDRGIEIQREREKRETERHVEGLNTREKENKKAQNRVGWK